MHLQWKVDVNFLVISAGSNPAVLQLLHKTFQVVSIITRILHYFSLPLKQVYILLRILVSSFSYSEIQ